MQAVFDFLWNLVGNNWEVIFGFVLGVGIISVYLQKLRLLLREAAQLFLDFDKAFEDGKVSKEEMELIKKSASELWIAIKAFGKK